ncbi:MAG: nicotinate (nicotinamide) nucleotide adenylyltransferase [Verrucomicrobiota bacterium]
MKPVRRVGLFGGTFDPIHMGHVEIVQAALSNTLYDLDKLIVMPCKLSPHKRDGQGPTEGRHRLQMIGIALREVKAVEISDYELSKESVSYTWQTIHWLQDQYPAAELVLVIGYDQYRVLDQWARFEELKDKIQCLVFSRHGQTKELSVERYTGLNLIFAEEQVVGISASEIRKYLRMGIEDDILAAELIHPKVIDYIQAQGLYSPH